MGRRAVLDGEGRLIQAGQSNVGGDHDWFILRRNTDGTLDSSFGTNGVLHIATGVGDDYVEEVVALEDGSYVIAGNVANSGNTDALLVKVTPAGALDGNFGSGGLLQIDHDTGGDSFRGLAVDKEGRIIAGGSASEFIVYRFWP